MATKTTVAERLGTMMGNGELNPTVINGSDTVDLGPIMVEDWTVIHFGPFIFQSYRPSSKAFIFWDAYYTHNAESKHIAQIPGALCEIAHDAGWNARDLIGRIMQPLVHNVLCNGVQVGRLIQKAEFRDVLGLNDLGAVLPSAEVAGGITGVQMAISALERLRQDLPSMGRNDPDFEVHEDEEPRDERDEVVEVSPKQTEAGSE